MFIVLFKKEFNLKSLTLLEEYLISRLGASEAVTDARAADAAYERSYVTIGRIRSER